jgi:very-short-patch-repair endonuclease
MPQKVINNYIVDFYCPKLALIIEVDGDVHDKEGAQRYDHERTAILENYNLKVLRFRNEEIDEEFDKVCMMITNEFRRIKT